MTDVLPTGAISQATKALPSAPAGAGGFFHELLSDLNPLQYIPVVGTIYRAITGDEGNPTLGFVASLGTGFAVGGPIEVAIAVGEKLAGVDPERAVMNAAWHLFHLGHDEPVATTSASPMAAVSGDASGLAFAMNTRNLTADDLNGLELQRLNA